MTWFEILAHPLFIAIAPALVTGLLGWLAVRYRTTQLERSIKNKSAKLERSSRRIEDLERTGRASSALDTQARAIKSALISKLNELLEHAHASRSTLYIPVEDDEGDFLGLLILCTAPTDLADSSFHGTIFAGRDAYAVRSYFERVIVTSESSVFQFDGFSPTGTYADCVFEKDGDSPPLGGCGGSGPFRQ